MSETEKKPTITKRQYNWHVHTAGMEADKAAREQGSPPDATRSVLMAAAGGKQIGAILAPAVHGGLLLMQEQLLEMIQGAPRLNTALGQEAALAYALLHPCETMQAIDDADIVGLAERIWKWLLEHTMADVIGVAKWIREEIRRMSPEGEAIAADVGKPKEQPKPKAG